MDQSMLIMGNVLDNDTDVDSPHSDFIVTTASADPIIGAYGTLMMNPDGSYRYQIDDANTAVLALQTGESVQEVFNYTMSDNDAINPKSASSTLTITIKGTNDAPVAVADVNEGDEGSDTIPSVPVVGNVLDNDTDVDSAHSALTVTSETAEPVMGTYGTLTLGTDGAYSYVIDDANPTVDALNVGEVLQDVFNYTISDNHPTDPKSSSSTLTININGVNDSPVAFADENSGDQGNAGSMFLVMHPSVMDEIKVNDVLADSMAENNVIDFPQEVLSAPHVASLESMGLHTVMNQYVDII